MGDEGALEIAFTPPSTQTQAARVYRRGCAASARPQLIAYHFDELFEVVPIIATGTGLGVAAAQPIDEVFDLG